jgi:hypothetical protein
VAGALFPAPATRGTVRVPETVKGVLMDFRVGDHIEVKSVKVDTPPRRGRVREVLDEQPVALLVAWEDGHESTFYPKGGMVRIVEASED